MQPSIMISKGRAIHTTLFALGEAPSAARNDTLSYLLKIYNERGAQQADTLLQPIIKNDNMKMSQALSDLNFVIRNDIGDARNSDPATTGGVDSLADAVTCWAQISKLENIDPVKSQILAKLLVEYKEKNPDIEIPRLWTSCG